MRTSAVLCIALTACARPIPELRIDGSPGVAPIVNALAESYRQANPKAPVRLGAGLGSAARIRALVANEIDVAMASHGIDTATLRREGIVAHEIARTAVVFATSADVTRSDISSTMVCDIYSGRLTNWSDALRIAPLIRPATEVDAEVALAAIPCLKSFTLAPSVGIIERPDEMASAIAERAGAFGLTSLPYVEGSRGRVRALSLDGVAPTPENVLSGRYPMSRRAFLLVRTPESPQVRRFLDFIRSNEGERVIRANGAIPAP